MKKTIGLFFLNYLRILAKLQIQKIKLLQFIKGKKLTIIGITASAGKSTTLTTLEAALSPDFKVKTNAGANSESGIPLNILGLKAANFSIKDWLKLSLLAPLKLLINWQTYEIFLVEMGIDEPTEPKNMSYLLKIIKPDIGIFLNVNPVHSAQFDHTVPPKFKGIKRLEMILKNIGAEKAKLINSLSQNGIGIINFDDKIVSASVDNHSSQIKTISKNSKADLRILKTSTGQNGFAIEFEYQNQNYALKLPKYVLPSVYETSIASGILTAVSLNLSPDKAVKNIETNLILPYSRSSILDGIKDTLIIDSSYNSSPSACIDMLNLLSEFPEPRIAVLGDMRELGHQSAQSHQDVCKLALNKSDFIITVGPETQKYFDNHPKIHKFIYWWQAAEFLKSQLKGKETILIKGSQNTIYTEEIVKSILKNPKDSNLICRQTPYWLKVKSDFKAKNCT